MSSQYPMQDVLFHVYHGGKFISPGNELVYNGGEVHSLESKPEAVLINLMESLNMSLIGHRIWYKLPFERFSELKIMCNGNDNFQRMCEAVYFTKIAEIFIEKDEDDDANGGIPANGRDIVEFRGVDDVPEHGENVPERDDDGASQHNEETAGTETVADGASQPNEAAYNDQGDVCDDNEILEEDARVEANIDGFEDEEESEFDEETPQNSDDEGGDVLYERSNNRGYSESGQLVLGQKFDTIAEFKDAVLDYCLAQKEKHNVKFSRWGSEKSEVKCASYTEGVECKFRIYCSFNRKERKYMIKTLVDEHSCESDGFCSVVKDKIIAKLLLNDIRKDPSYKPSKMQDAMEEKFDITVSNDQCRKAKKKALMMIQDEYDAQFRRIKDYRLELLRSNPGSTVEVQTVRTDDGEEEFDRFYVCFQALKRTWIAHCRPIIGIDGCFLKNDVKGQLLAAVGRDANNQMFPVAWAVVKAETKDTWLWFLKLLKSDLEIAQKGKGFTLISDRQKGLIWTVEQELPDAEHRMCARHIYGNLRRVYPGKQMPKKLFWAIAKAYNEGEYKVALDALKEFDVKVYDAVLLKNPRNCSRAFFSYNAVCEDVSNNFSESYNNSINKAREMPLIEMLETIRRQAMTRMDIRRKKALKHQAKYSLKVGKTFKVEEKFKTDCRVHPSGNGMYEVSENGSGVTVDMVAQFCACRRWSMTGIPCRHALRVILYRKLKKEDYVSHWYLTSTWRSQYNDLIRPVNGINFWRTSGEPTINPPKREVTHGPTKKQKRIKGLNESPQKKSKGKVAEPVEKKTKLPRQLGPVRCSRCGLLGHNSRGCRNGGVPNFKPPPKPKKSAPGEGSSTQPSQNSCVE